MKEFDIPFEGLKLGEHLFEYQVTDAFFEGFENSIIQGGNLLVRLSLEKKETLMLGFFSIEGEVYKPCDRCNDTMDIPISTSTQIIYQFEEGESEDENLIYVSPSEFLINVETVIYELISVAVPHRSIHEQDQCNKEMLELLNKYRNPIPQKNIEEPVIDARWDKLKKLK